MNQQRGTPTVIRYARTKDLIAVVVTVSTPSAFTAHFHAYQTHNPKTSLHESAGYWPDEKGAIEAFDAWVIDNGGYLI